jgi:hypothetical protein
LKRINFNLKYTIILLLALAFLVCAMLGLTHIANNFEQVGQHYTENFNANVNRQFSSIVMLFMMGLIILLPERKRIGTTQTLLLSFIVGLLTFEFISALLLIFHIYYSLLSVLVVYFVYVVLLYVFMLKKDKDALAIKNKDVTKIVFWVILSLALGYALSKVPINILSFDSIEYKNLGQIFVKEHYIAQYALYQMSGHAFIPTLLNSIAAMFNFGYAYAIQNMFLVTSLLLFGYVLFDETRKRGIGEKKAFVFALIGFLVLATSFFVIFLGVCLLPNIFAGFFMLFLMYYMYKYIRDKDTINLALSFIFMVAFCFTRVEGPLVAVFIVAYFAHKNIKAKQMLKYTWGVFATLALWYTSFFLHVGGNFDSAFLTVGKTALITGLFLVLGAYIYLKDKFFSKINDKLFTLFIVAVIVFTIGINILDISKFNINLKTMFQNMFYEGFWFTAWFGIIILSIGAMILTKKKNTFLEGIIPIFLILLFAIFAFRETTLHINWSDSGNRMLMHIYPLIIFVLADNIISYFTADKKKKIKK